MDEDFAELAKKFESAVQKGIDAKKKAAEFNASWKDKKGHVLLIFGTFANILSRLGVGGSAGPDNGGVLLKSRGWELKFSSQRDEAKKILCTSNMPGFETRSYGDLAALTDEEVGEVAAIFGEFAGGAEENPAYVIDRQMHP
jgi:hypothetical protein